MKIIGKTSIHPVFFYTGKIAGYFTWVILVLEFFGIHPFFNSTFLSARIVSVLFLIAGLIISIISLFNLGKSTSLGLPDENTDFKMDGLYKLSRNPMYLGFNLMTIASVMYFMHPVLILCGIYSIIIYHFIILAEEKFLTLRFGVTYKAYKNKVRRYL